MNCQEFNQLAPALASDQLLEASRKAAAEAHIAICAVCASRLSLEGSLARALRLASEAEKETAPPHVKAALLQAFAAQTRAETASNVVAFPAPARRFRQWAIAAALLLGVALPSALLWRYTRTGAPNREITFAPPVNQATPRVEATPGPVVSSAPNNNGSGISAPVKRAVGGKSANSVLRRETMPRFVAARQPSRPPVKKRPGVTAAANDSYRGFIALTYNQHANEGGMIVRVNVTRATLAALGLPANGENGEEKVEADLLVSDDGVARAIRFVPENERAGGKPRR
jgi:hypothetical protein